MAEPSFLIKKHRLCFCITVKEFPLTGEGQSDIISQVVKVSLYRKRNHGKKGLDDTAVGFLWPAAD